MTFSALVIFIALSGLAAYVQTLTGFAFGLIMMGAVALFGVMDLPEAAVFVGMLTLFNAGQMLMRGWRHVDRPALAMILTTSLVSLIAGYELLRWLAAGQMDALRLVLGLVVVVSSLQLIAKPEPLAIRSHPASFASFGIISGLMAGLFSTGGPPLVYHLYRQPWPIATIRESLVAAFGIASAIRVAVVAASGDLPPLSHFSALAAVPVVMLATHAARRWPPKLSPTTLRRIVFVLLLLSGVALAAPAALHMAQPMLDRTTAAAS